MTGSQINELLMDMMLSLSRCGVFVYFAITDECPAMIKIGHSADPLRRVSQFRTGNSRNIKLYDVIFFENKSNAISGERVAHRLLESFHVKGEWFSFNQGAVDDAIEEVFDLSVEWATEREELITHAP